MQEKYKTIQKYSLEMTAECFATSDSPFGVVGATGIDGVPGVVGVV